jgi:NAD(P)-dependent dehydrogenase (short-subunit alcohol dehydrogenase family)
MAKLLEGKVAIITGAGGGIGREHALYFAKEGAKVVVNDLGGDRHGGGKGGEMADKTVADIKAAGGEAVANYDSVATREGADGILWSALAKFGKVDILVNNAGILRDRTIVNMSDSDLNLVLDVHLKGTFYCMQAVARQLKVQGKGGRIVNTTSLSGLIGNFGQGNYAAAKGGIYSMTRDRRARVRQDGRDRERRRPGGGDAHDRGPADDGGHQQADDLGPQFISPVAAFLASDLASDLTGQIVGVQGRKVFVYRMEQTAGVSKDKGSVDPAELKERWAEIAK